MSADTLIYDLTTGQWHQWGTLEDTGGGVFDNARWNMILGVFWQELKGGDGQPIYATVAAGIESNEIFRVDPESEIDNGGTDNEQYIRRQVTGGLSIRNRVFPRQFDLRLTASVGDPAVAGADVNLRFSDDNGNTWVTPLPISLTAGAWSQDLVWRSLGIIRAPLRIFEITDTGGLVRISTVAQARVDGDE